MIKCKKIIVVLFVIFILFTFGFGFSNIYAEVNTTYGTNSSSITSSGVEEAIESNIIMDTLGSFIYSVTGIFEDLISFIVGIITGTRSFPWADEVIFNSLPLLDINFINPSSGSFFEDSTGKITTIGNIIGNLYYTVFIISVSLFGVCVGVMSLRLLFSSIASEKAKYKQAITNLAFAILLLFLSHYIISFVFMINEKMVEVASSILSTAVEDVDINKLKFTNNYEEQREIVIAFFEAGLDLFKDENTEIENDIKNHWRKVLNDALEDEELIKSMYYLINNETYRKLALPNINDIHDSALDKIKNNFKNAFSSNSTDSFINALNDASELKKLMSLPEVDSKLEEYKKKSGRDEQIISILKQIWQSKKENSDANPSEKVFSNMGDYFKSSAWQYYDDNDNKVIGWKPNKISVIGVILYAMFTVQSMMFFIAYLKRFFYVTMLALFAPAVIVFDFLEKSIK